MQLRVPDACATERIFVRREGQGEPARRRQGGPLRLHLSGVCRTLSKFRVNPQRVGPTCSHSAAEQSQSRKQFTDTVASPPPTLIPAAGLFWDRRTERLSVRFAQSDTRVAKPWRQSGRRV